MDSSGMTPYIGMVSSVPNSLEQLLMRAPGSNVEMAPFVHLRASTDFASAGLTAATSASSSSTSSDDDMPPLDPVTSQIIAVQHDMQAGINSNTTETAFLDVFDSDGPPFDIPITHDASLTPETSSSPEINPTPPPAAEQRPSNNLPLRRSSRSAAVAARRALETLNKRPHPTSNKNNTNAPLSKKVKLEESDLVSVSDLKDAPAQAKNDADYEVTAEEETENEAEAVSCCICMSEPEIEELSTIDGCDHQFCFACISKWADRENTCPLCKHRFSKIARVNPGKRKKGAPPNSRKVKQRDQRSDIISGSALEGLLASLTANRHLTGSQRMRNFLLARVAGFPTTATHGGLLPFARHHHERFHFSLADEFLNDSDDDGDTAAATATDISISFSHFTRRIAQGQPRVNFAAASAPIAAMPGMRSWAVRPGDRAAGNSNNNPIEIDDTDDDDDDDVEVVEVSQSSST